MAASVWGSRCILNMPITMAFAYFLLGCTNLPSSSPRSTVTYHSAGNVPSSIGSGATRERIVQNSPDDTTRLADEARRAELARLEEANRVTEKNRVAQLEGDRQRQLELAKREAEVARREMEAAKNQEKREATARGSSSEQDFLKDKIKFGSYHAIVIGNQRYKGSLPSLKTPEADAQAVSDILRDQYRFESVQTLRNVNRIEVISALDSAIRRLKNDDNLLIYYAGHGIVDQITERGYWLGVDANTTSRSDWISNADISDTLKGTKAKHVIVVADSCFSGSLVRGVSVVSLSNADIARLANTRSRTVLTSGNLEPVIDGGGGRHSVFAKAFIDALRDNEGIIDGSRLFLDLRRKVMLSADQTPQYANIRFTDHDGGDFLFVRRSKGQ